MQRRNASATFALPWASGLTGILATAMVMLMPAWAAAQAPGNADGKTGPEAFNNNCRTCHSIKEGDNRMGPSLHKIVGRKAGTGSGYANYSQGMKSSGITWDDATLDKFITNPDAVIPNNNMKPFKGVPDEAARAKIIAYLRAN